MRPLAFVLLTTLAAGPPAGAEAPRPRLADRPSPLTNDARAQVRLMLKKAAPKAKPAFPRAAMTIELARHYADVHPKLTWQAEFGEWFVFGVPGWKGGPDPWSGVVFVQKGSNMVGYYRETW